MVMATGPLRGQGGNMRNYLIPARFAASGIAASLLCVTAPRASAQSAILTLPDVSQHARLSQRIGLTDLTIDYHRPLTAGRKVFGGLQPSGEVWRAGANYNPTF